MPDNVAKPVLKHLEREICQLRDRTRARSIVMVLDDGEVAAWRAGLPPEDIRHEIITAANKVRTAVAAQQDREGGER